MIQQTAGLFLGCATWVRCFALGFHVSPLNYHLGPVLMAPESCSEALSRAQRGRCFAEGPRVGTEVLVPQSCRTRSDQDEKGRFPTSLLGLLQLTLAPSLPSRRKGGSDAWGCCKSCQLILPPPVGACMAGMEMSLGSGPHVSCLETDVGRGRRKRGWAGELVSL